MERRRSLRLSNKLLEQAAQQETVQQEDFWLPDEMWLKIFTMLDLNTLLKCRLVSRRFNQLAKEIRVTNLCVHNSYDTSSCPRDFAPWFIDEPVHLRTHLKRSFFNIMQTEFMRSILSKVRRLFVYHINDVRSEWIRFLDTGLFNYVQYLQITELECSPNQKLVLPSVKVLEIDGCYESLILSAPHLTKLAWYSPLDELKFDETVTSNITELACYEDNLREFVNEHRRSEEMTAYKKIEQLHIKGYAYQPIDINNLIHLMPSLKAIHYDKIFGRNYMLERLNRAKESSKPNLVVSFNDFIVTGQDDVRDLLNGSFSDPIFTTNLVITHYDKLVDVAKLIDTLSYSRLINEFKTLSANFNTRFPRIKKVLVNQVVKEKSNFVEFIRGFPMLTHLEISNSSSIDQAFYDDLHVYCGYIAKLSIEEHDPNFTLDSSFITKHQHLVEYRVNRTMSIELIKCAFKNLKSFKKIAFVLAGKKVEFSFDSRGCLKIEDKIINARNRIDYLGVMKEILQLASSQSA